MRLADLDAIRERFNVAEYCSNCKHKNFDCYKEQGYSPRRICEELDDVPVIDAIPLDWLYEKLEEKRQQEYGQFGVASISRVLMYWEKEKEEM